MWFLEFIHEWAFSFDIFQKKFVIKFDGKGKKALSGKQVSLWDSAETMKLPLGTRVVGECKGPTSTMAPFSEIASVWG
jgi:hypothetical protein